MTRQAEIEQKYLPSLDGMRAFSIALVVISHYGLGHIIPGGFGVTVFFFISGFIISRLLIAEFTTNNAISFKSFYIRRFLRLAPALIVYISVSTIFVYLIEVRFQTAELVSALLYGANYYNIYVGYREPAPYLILWSLAIEEHYYIVYPLLASALFSNRKRALILLSFLVMAVLLWRVYLVYGLNVYDTNHARIYMGTDTRIDSIIYGAILAIALATNINQRLIQFFANYWIMAGALILLLLTFIYRDESFRETFRYSIQGLALTPLICSIVFAPRFSQIRSMLENRMLVYIGKLSYSLYLYHWLGKIAADWAAPRYDVPWLWVAIPIAAVTALISYHAIERQMIKYRKAFGSHAG
jgi:peptidoglycan/LPS O-acetylase OafA/YrhL